MAKLWDKGYSLDRLVEAFTVGEDPVLDARLVNADCVASMAHATMLASVGLLQETDRAAIVRGLSDIMESNKRGEFSVLRTDEDVHTAIENRLVLLIGEAGKRVHTGRSRNDQVLAALRLWSRGFLFSLLRESLALADRLLDFAEKHASDPMPGRTHLQIAMPSSVGLWSAAYAEELLEDVELGRSAFSITDCCPLGSAASYGVPLPLDRELVARLLGFGRVQNNVLAANNSRGRHEAIVLGAAEQVAQTLSKMAQDLILFSLPELGYFSIPQELCSGSSIMPQKRNPDGLELVRAKSATISADLSGIKSVTRALPSGYNRDFQETKGPFFRGCESALGCARVMRLTVERLQVNPDRLRAAFPPEIFATDRALELVAEGMPFREAYRKVSESLGSLQDRDPVEALRLRVSTGTPGNLRLDLPRSDLQTALADLDRQEASKRAAVTRLVGREVALFEDPLEVPPR